MLPNKITTDQQLNAWGAENIPGFKGVYSRDSISKVYPRLRGGNSVILNLDPGYASGGTHWVALRVSSEAPIVYYKDSFGGPPPADVVRAIAGGRGLIYGNRINQKLRENNCGRRAAEWLYAMAQAAGAGGEIEYFESTEQ